VDIKFKQTNLQEDQMMIKKFVLAQVCVKADGAEIICFYKIPLDSQSVHTMDLGKFRPAKSWRTKTLFAAVKTGFIPRRGLMVLKGLLWKELGNIGTNDHCPYQTAKQRAINRAKSESSIQRVDNGNFIYGAKIALTRDEALQFIQTIAKAGTIEDQVREAFPQTTALKPAKAMHFTQHA
jgi:hypothetical protein